MNFTLCFSANTNFKKAMIAVYVIAGSVGVIVIILFFMCIVQRLLTHKPKECEENNLSNARRENETNRQQTEPVVYYTAQPQTSEGAGGDASVPYRNDKKCPLPDGNVAAAPTDDRESTLGGPTIPDESTPMLPQEYVNPQGSPVHMMPVGGSPVHMIPQGGAAAMLPQMCRPISQPPSYEDVLRQDGIPTYFEAISEDPGSPHSSNMPSPLEPANPLILPIDVPDSQHPPNSEQSQPQTHTPPQSPTPEGSNVDTQQPSVSASAEQQAKKPDKPTSLDTDKEPFVNKD